jgi:3-oxoacyl-[acyl-carrier protein] reductase
MISQTPLGRLGQPNDIAKVAVFLASDDSAWVNGEKITVSGGLR